MGEKVPDSESSRKRIGPAVMRPIIRKRTSSIHVTTVSLMYGSTSVCRQKQSTDGRLRCSVASKLASTRSSVSNVRHWNARRHSLLTVHRSSSSSSWLSVDAVSRTSVSSRQNSDCSTAHIISDSRSQFSLSSTTTLAHNRATSHCINVFLCQQGSTTVVAASPLSHVQHRDS